MNCRHCGCALHEPEHVFVDLGTAPPSNAYLSQADLARGEVWLPLKALACPDCRLVQIEQVPQPDELFAADYAYFSSYSASWLAHAQRFVEQAVQTLALGTQSLVVELASNDGYLLQYVAERGIACYGVEPTAGTAAAARARGIETVQQFFGLALARQLRRERGPADLIVANNVLAHVPAINDFTAGIAALLADDGAASVEFPHLLQLVRHSQFDTLYHEHYSYLSLITVQRICARAGLQVWDVEALPTHGGSLRVWLQHASPAAAPGARPPRPSVQAMLDQEHAAGMAEDAFYRAQQPRAESLKDALLAFLLEHKRAGTRLAAYGAAAKGNTLLNFAGVRADLLPCVADANPHKQGRRLPGSRIPIVSPEALLAQRPDLILILPWNLSAEIEAQLGAARAWGARLATAVPQLRVW